MQKAAKFIIFRDFAGEYRWRLRSAAGATIAASETGHHKKSGCEADLKHWRFQFPDLPVRDATIRSFDKQAS